MKKLSFLFMSAFIMLTGAFTSCDKIADEIENATEVTVSTTLEASMVAVPEQNKSTDADGTFKVSETIDLANNADLKDHLDKIKDIKATLLTITIASVTPANLTLSTATFTITDNVSGIKFIIPNINQLPLTVGQSVTFSTNTANWNLLNQILASKNQFTIDGVGTINNEEFSITFKTSIGVDATVKM